MAEDAHAALAALADLPRYEERLTNRAAGITGMVWGLAVPGIFLTYNLVGHAFGDGWPMAFLWAPWVAAASVVTGMVWHTQAVTLRRDPRTAKGVTGMLLAILGFFAIMGAVFLVVHTVLDVAWGVNVIMVLVTGLFAVAGGLLQWRLRAYGPAQAAAGVALCVLAFALAPLGLSPPQSGLVGAAAGGLCYFLPGLYAALKG